MSEMTALEYSKARGRMTDNCKISCYDCPLYEVVKPSDVNCHKFLMKYPEKAIEIVEKWVKENPIKTYKDVFLEKFPDATIGENLIPFICRKFLFKSQECVTLQGMTCSQCWNQEYKI